MFQFMCRDTKLCVKKTKNRLLLVQHQLQSPFRTAAPQETDCDPAAATSWGSRGTWERVSSAVGALPDQGWTISKTKQSPCLGQCLRPAHQLQLLANAYPRRQQGTAQAVGLLPLTWETPIEFLALRHLGIEAADGWALSFSEI